MDGVVLVFDNDVNGALRPFLCSQTSTLRRERITGSQGIELLRGAGAAATLEDVDNARLFELENEETQADEELLGIARALNAHYSLNGATEGFGTDADGLFQWVRSAAACRINDFKIRAGDSSRGFVIRHSNRADALSDIQVEVMLAAVRELDGYSEEQVALFEDVFVELSGVVGFRSVRGVWVPQAHLSSVEFDSMERQRIRAAQRLWDRYESAIAGIEGPMLFDNDFAHPWREALRRAGLDRSDDLVDYWALYDGGQTEFLKRGALAQPAEAYILGRQWVDVDDFQGATRAARQRKFDEQVDSLLRSLPRWTLASYVTYERASVSQQIAA